MPLDWLSHQIFDFWGCETEQLRLNHARLAASSLYTFGLLQPVATAVPIHPEGWTLQEKTAGYASSCLIYITKKEPKQLQICNDTTNGDCEHQESTSTLCVQPFVAVTAAVGFDGEYNVAWRAATDTHDDKYDSHMACCSQSVVGCLSR